MELPGIGAIWSVHLPNVDRGGCGGAGEPDPALQVAGIELGTGHPRVESQMRLDAEFRIDYKKPNRRSSLHIRPVSPAHLQMGCTKPLSQMEI